MLKNGRDISDFSIIPKKKSPLKVVSGLKA